MLSSLMRELSFVMVGGRLKVVRGRLSVVSGQSSVVIGRQNPKSQISKLQRNPNAQIPNPKPAAAPGAWSLDLGASLGFGFWDLDFSFITQRLHRIDLGRAAGRQDRRDDSGEGQSDDGAGERNTISVSDAEQ